MAPVKPEWEQDFAIIPEGSIFAPELEAQRTDNAKDNVPLEKAPSVFVADVTDALINYLTADQVTVMIYSFYFMDCIRTSGQQTFEASRGFQKY